MNNICHTSHKNNLLCCTVIIADIIYRYSFISELSKWQLLHLNGIHSSRICKQADFTCIHTSKNIFILTVSSFFVSLISGFVYCPGISKTVHQKDNFHFLYFLFFINSFRSIFYYCTTYSAVFFFYLLQFFYNYLGHRRIIIQNIFIQSNFFHGFFMLCHKCFNFQSNQLVKTHI